MLFLVTDVSHISLVLESAGNLSNFSLLKFSEYIHLQNNFGKTHFILERV